MVLSNAINSNNTYIAWEPSQPAVSNLGIAYSAGTFTVQGATAALSTTNVAYVTLQSTTSGLLKTVPITVNQTFTDGTGTLNLSNFGVTSNIAWNTDMPFFLYAVLKSDGTAIAFMISRLPGFSSAPVAGQIGQSGTPATTANTWFSLATITAANYASQPALMIGSFRMKKTTTSNNWTVSTLGSGDGIGVYQQGKAFNMPTGQNGASAGTYFLPNGGTAPNFTTQSVDYKWEAFSRQITIWAYHNGDGGTAGAGVVSLTMSVPLPITIPAATSVAVTMTVWVFASAAGAIDLFQIIAGFPYVQFLTAAATNVTNASFIAGGRNVQGVLVAYPAEA